MATTASSAAAVVDNNKSSTPIYDNLVWFSSSNRSWWPALYYQSHQQALQRINLSRDVKDVDHRVELTLKLLQEKREGPQPVVQLIRSSSDTSEGIRLTTVTENDQVQHDFLRFLVQLGTPSDDLWPALAIVEGMLDQDLAASNNNNAPTIMSSSRTKEQAAPDDHASKNAAPPRSNTNNAILLSSSSNGSSTSNTTVETLKQIGEESQSITARKANTNKSPYQVSTNKASSLKNTTPPSPEAMTVKDPTRNLGPELSQEFHANRDKVGTDDDDIIMANDNDDDSSDDYEQEAIDADDSWEIVWFKLQKAGWYKRASIEDPLQSFFVKPGRGISEGYLEGTDYFSSEEATKAYIRQEYPHWKAGDARRVSVSAVKDNTTPGNRTKPQDPALPLLSSARSTASQFSLESCDFESFGAVWNILKQKGWRVIRAKNPLQDWWYIRPGRSANGTAGLDYFETAGDVIEFCQAERRAKKEETDPVQHVAVQGAHSTRKRKQQPRGKGLPRKKLLSSSTSKKRRSAQSGTKKTNKRNKTTTTSNEHWWKYEAIPAFEVMWPILEKFGFSKTVRGYKLPKDTTGLSEIHRIPIFQTATGLRKFLCCYGVPGYEKYESKLSDDECEQLRRWIAFANVPVHPGNSVKKLRDVSAFKKDSDIKHLLFDFFGFSTANQKIYVPSYTQIGEMARLNQKHGVHYFHDHELHTAVKCYVRKAWRFGVLFESEETPGSPDRFLTPTKVMNRRKQEAHLRLRLWAAVTSQDVTTFQQMPEEEYLRPYEQIPDIEEVNSDEDDEDDNSVSSLPESSSDESTMTTETPVASPSREDESILESINTHSPVPEKRRVKPKPVVNKPVYPDFKSEIWPILQQVGFAIKSSKYVHPQLCRSIESGEELQKFICSKGIPNADSLDKDQDALMHLWASFAFVDAPVSSIPDLLMEKQPTGKQIRSWLVDLGFSFFDGKIFPPGSDSLPGSRSKRQHKIHYYLGMDEVRDYIRQAENLSLIDEGHQSRRRQSKKFQEITLKVRTWAATSPSPLPKFDASEEKRSNGDELGSEKDGSPDDVSAEQADTNSLPHETNVDDSDDSPIEESEDREQATESDPNECAETDKGQTQILTCKENEPTHCREENPISDQGDPEVTITDNSNVENHELETETRISMEKDSANEKENHALLLPKATSASVQSEVIAAAATETTVALQTSVGMSIGSTVSQKDENTFERPLEKRDDLSDETQLEVGNESQSFNNGECQTFNYSQSVDTSESQTGAGIGSPGLEDDESQTLNDSESVALKELRDKNPAQSAIQSIDTSHSVPRPSGTASSDGSVASKGSLNPSVLESLSEVGELSIAAAKHPRVASLRRNQGLDVLVTFNYDVEQPGYDKSNAATQLAGSEDQDLDSSDDNDSNAGNEENFNFGAPSTQLEIQDLNSDSDTDDCSMASEDDDNNDSRPPLTQADEEYLPFYSCFNSY